MSWLLGKPLIKSRTLCKQCMSIGKKAIWRTRSCKRCSVLFYFESHFVMSAGCHAMTYMGVASVMDVALVTCQGLTPLSTAILPHHTVSRPTVINENTVLAIYSLWVWTNKASQPCCKVRVMASPILRLDKQKLVEMKGLCEWARGKAGAERPVFLLAATHLHDFSWPRWSPRSERAALGLSACHQAQRASLRDGTVYPPPAAKGLLTQMEIAARVVERMVL